MEIATQETAYLIDRLVDDILAPLRKDGIDIDAAARRSLRYLPSLSSRSVLCVWSPSRRNRGATLQIRLLSCIVISLKAFQLERGLLVQAAYKEGEMVLGC